MGVGRDESDAAIETAGQTLMRAIERTKFFGEQVSLDGMNIEELIQEFAKKIKEGKVTPSQLLNEGVFFVRDATKIADKQSEAKAKQAAVFVKASIEEVKGLNDRFDDTRVNELAQNLQSDLVDQGRQGLLEKQRADLTDKEFELIKTATLTDAVERELSDDQLKELFNVANDRMKEELHDVKDNDGNSLADKLPEKIEKGDENFKAMKESFKDEMVSFMRANDNIPSGANQAIMSSRALFGSAPYFDGVVPTISLSDFSGNMLAVPDNNPNPDFKPINFGDGAKPGETLGAGADQGIRALKSAEMKSDNVVTKVQKAANTAAVQKAETNRKIDMREEAADKKQDQKEEAEKEASGPKI